LRPIRLLLAAFFLIIHGAAFASEDARFTLNGDYKNILSASRALTGADYYGDLNRLRLDAGYRPSPDATLKLVLDNEAVFGTVLDTAEFKAGKDLRQTYYDAGWTFTDNADVWGRTSIHRFFLTAKAGNASGTLGRQRIAWGSGRLWNPTDVFNPVNPLSIERDEKTGTDAARVDLYPAPLSGVTGVYAPEREGRDDGALRARTNVKGYDVSLMLASLNNRDLAGLEFAGDLGDASLRGEATYEELKTRDALFPGRSDRFSRAVLSMDYTFPSTLYVLLEYLYNGGNMKQDISPALVQTEIVTKNRNFLAAGLGFDLTPLVRAEGILMLDIDQGGSFLNPSIRYNILENADWVAGAQFFSNSGEFANIHDLYFTSFKIYF
jgi:hypothetical protein